MHIGLIGGIGPAATEFYYRNLVRVFNAEGRSLELTIVHAQVSDLVENIAASDAEKQAETFYELALRLHSSGAHAIAITAISGHFCISEFEKLSPLPILNAIPLLEGELLKRKIKRVGLLGSGVSMESKLFGGMPRIEVVIPSKSDLIAVEKPYTEIAITGAVRDDQREFMFSVGSDLCTKQGAEAVVLAGTDLCFVFDGFSSGFPVIDSALIHIQALFKASSQNTMAE